MAIVKGLLLLALVSTVVEAEIYAGSNYFENIFSNDYAWPDPEGEYTRLHMSFDSPQPWKSPFFHFNESNALMYFTRGEYEAYGRRYWSADEEYEYRSYPHHFEYVIQRAHYPETYAQRTKTCGGGRSARFLNYTYLDLMAERMLFADFAVYLDEAAQNQVLRIVQRRTYGFVEATKLHELCPDITNKLMREIFRHAVFGYDRYRVLRKEYEVWQVVFKNSEELEQIGQGIIEDQVQRLRYWSYLRGCHFLQHRKEHGD